MTQFKPLRKLWRLVKNDEIFLNLLEVVEALVSKVLSIGMIVVILAAVWDLGVFLSQELLTGANATGFFKGTLIDIFGLFLSILIALEVLENITGYLRKHVIQIELVIATALTAVGRKIIILDPENLSGIDLIGLAVAILSLSISYWIVRNMVH